MPYNDLREFLRRLEAEGELVRVTAEVDPEWEVGAIMRKVFDKRGKAVLFERVKGSTMPLVSGAMDTFRRYALGIDAPGDLRSILDKGRAALAEGNRIAPVIVDGGPCQENFIPASEIDLSIFPVPRWHHLDAGRFIGTLGVVFLKDPDTGVRNVGVYRQQIQGRAKVGIASAHQAGIIVEKWLDRGKAVPVATAIGVEPAVLAASCFHAPLGEDELEIAGALKGKPVELVKCRTIDLEVPATAEIVLEGEIPADRSLWEEEGPFGEFTGYYGGVVTRRPSIFLKAITHRNNPIYQGTLEGKPPSESRTLTTVGYSLGTWMKLKGTRVTGIKEVLCTDMGCCNFWTVVSMDKQYYQGNARQAIYALWATGMRNHKWVIVVDGDIDIYDRGQVEWALATCVQPHRDIIITSEGEPAHELDPSLAPDKREHPFTKGSRVGIDATRQFKGYEFPPEIQPRPEEVRQVDARWKEYGLD